MLRVLVIAASVLALAACGRAQVKHDGSAVFHGRDGSTVTVGHGAPKNLPGYLKAYPGATIKSSLDSGANGGVLVMETSAGPEAVIDFYKREAAAAGLQVQMDSNNPGAPHVVMFSDPDGKRNFNVSATPQPSGKTDIGLTYNAQA
jgi:hypothetical protein